MQTIRRMRNPSGTAVLSGSPPKYGRYHRHSKDYDVLPLGGNRPISSGSPPNFTSTADLAETPAERRERRELRRLRRRGSSSPESEKTARPESPRINYNSAEPRSGSAGSVPMTRTGSSSMGIVLAEGRTRQSQDGCGKSTNSRAA